MIKIGRRTYTKEEYERELLQDWHGDYDSFWIFWGITIAILSVIFATIMIFLGFR